MTSRMTNMRSRFHPGLPILLLVTGGILVALLLPNLVSAYHLETGGRSLKKSAHQTYDSALALEHLQKAIKWQPSNAQAYRLLAKVYQEQGDWSAAVEALNRYTELRPGNPLGQVDLAKIYAAVETEMAAARVVDLMAMLPKAGVETPDSQADTPYAQVDGPLWSSYVTTTTFSLPPDFRERPTLFMYPPSTVAYTLTLPREPTTLLFGMGMALASQDQPEDGATFQVSVDGREVFREHLDGTTARQGWHEQMVDLSPWAGQEVTLALAVTAGTTGNATGNWSGWGEPRVVDKQFLALESLVPNAQQEEEWKRAGLTSDGFVVLGQQAREAERYDEAMTWFEWALRQEPDLGDTWYHIGQLYENQKQWLRALDAYERAMGSSYLRQVQDSSPHYRAGVLYQRRLRPRQLDKALAAYTVAVETDDFESTTEAADCRLGRGEVLRWLKVEPDEYIAEFQRALELNPWHANAYLMLGLAYYDRDRDAIAAEAEIYKALSLAPDSKWIHYYLAGIYRQEGRIEEAVAAYQQALKIDPDFEAAQTALTELGHGE